MQLLFLLLRHKCPFLSLVSKSCICKSFAGCVPGFISLCDIMQLRDDFAWCYVTWLPSIESYLCRIYKLVHHSPPMYFIVLLSLSLSLLRKCHGDMSRLVVYFVFGQNFRSGKVSTFLSCRGCTVRLNFSGILCGYGSLVSGIRPSVLRSMAVM